MPPAAAPSTPPAGKASSGGLSGWLWIGLIVAAALLAAAVVILMRPLPGRGRGRKPRW